MKIIEKLWFTTIDGSLGIIVIEEDFAKVRKAYIGPSSGRDEALDTERIISLGAKFPFGIAKSLADQLNPKNKGRRP